MCDDSEGVQLRIIIPGEGILLHPMKGLLYW